MLGTGTCTGTWTTGTCYWYW